LTISFEYGIIVARRLRMEQRVIELGMYVGALYYDKAKEAIMIEIPHHESTVQAAVEFLVEDDVIRLVR